MGIVIRSIEIRNFISIGISEWSQISVVIYTCGLVVLLFLISLIVQIILTKKENLKIDNKLKSSFIMGIFGLIYFCYFLIFFAYFFTYNPKFSIGLPGIWFFPTGYYFGITILSGLGISIILLISGLIWFFSRKKKLKQLKENEGVSS